MTTATEQPQTSFSEEPLADAAIEEALDDRHDANLARKPLNKRYREFHSKALALIEQKELPDGAYRAGKFVVKIGQVEEREIAFERTARRSVRFSLAKT